MAYRKILENIAILTFIFGWGLGGTVMYWITDNPDWLLGWVITLIIGMAG